MPEMYTRGQYNHLNLQKKFAWAKYYEVKQELLEATNVMLRQVNLPREQGKLQLPNKLPKHITLELFEMAEKLNKEYTCPICLDLTTKETIHITWCGHVLCKECFDDIKKRHVNETKCPICRRSL